VEEYPRPFYPDRPFCRALEQTRKSKQPNLLSGKAAEDATLAVREIIRPLLVAAGLPNMLIVQYGWFAAELAKHLRTRTATDLAFHLEAMVRKWTTLGLHENTLQLLICEVLACVRPPVVKPEPPMPARPDKEDSDEHAEA
jgi:hypothetical protein